MNTEPEKHELIEKYLTEGLKDDELARFEEALQSDRHFAKEVELHRLTGELLTEAAQDSFKKKIHTAEKAYFSEKSVEKKKIVPIRIVLRIAAAVVLLLAGAYAVYFINHQSDANPETLFTENFKPAAYYGTRSTDSTAGTVLQKAYEDYKNGNYRDALAGLKKAETQTPDDLEILFFKGNCLLATADTKNAISTFQQLIDSGNPLYLRDAGWYLALAYLQKGDTEAAKIQLKKLTTSDTGPYQKKAEDLLRSLN